MVEQLPFVRTLPVAILNYNAGIKNDVNDNIVTLKLVKCVLDFCSCAVNERVPMRKRN
jgi:hypothetical protein